MFTTALPPARTRPGSLCAAQRLLPFRHRLPPIVTAQSGGVNAVGRDHLVAEILRHPGRIAPRGVAPPAAAAGHQAGDVASGQPIARTLSEDHLAAVLVQHLHEIRRPGAAAGHTPRRGLGPAAGGGGERLLGGAAVATDQPPPPPKTPRRPGLPSAPTPIPPPAVPGPRTPR